MTVADVEDTLKLIRNSACDPEMAHSYEDDLYLTILAAIARGEAEDPVAMAALAITTQTLDFPRWCA